MASTIEATELDVKELVAEGRIEYTSQKVNASDNTLRLKNL